MILILLSPLNLCIFYYCSCTSWGGVIYFKGGNNIELLKLSIRYCFNIECSYFGRINTINGNGGIIYSVK